MKKRFILGLAASSLIGVVLYYQPIKETRATIFGGDVLPSDKVLIKLKEDEFTGGTVYSNSDNMDEPINIAINSEPSITYIKFSISSTDDSMSFSGNVSAEEGTYAFIKNNVQNDGTDYYFEVILSGPCSTTIYYQDSYKDDGDDYNYIVSRKVNFYFNSFDFSKSPTLNETNYDLGSMTPLSLETGNEYLFAIKYNYAKEYSDYQISFSDPNIYLVSTKYEDSKYVVNLKYRVLNGSPLLTIPNYEYTVDINLVEDNGTSFSKNYSTSITIKNSGATAKTYNTKLVCDNDSSLISSSSASIYMTIEDMDPSKTYVPYSKDGLSCSLVGSSLVVTSSKPVESELFVHEMDSTGKIIKTFTQKVKFYTMSNELELNLKTVDSNLTLEVLAKDYLLKSSDLKYVQIKVNGTTINLVDSMKFSLPANQVYDIVISAYNSNSICIAKSPNYHIENNQIKEEVKIPAVNISMTKLSDGAFAKGEEIIFNAELENVVLDSSNTINWKIDGTNSSKDRSFTKVFDQSGEHQVTCEVINNDSVVCSSTKTIVIKEDSSSNIILSMEKESVIASTSGDTFKIKALLDGMLLDGYDYSWTIKDNSIIDFYVDPNGSNEIALKPLKTGKTTIYASCSPNKGKEAQTVSLEVEVIGAVTEYEIGYSNSNPKPNEKVEAYVICDGVKNVININPVWEVTSSKGGVVEYESLGEGKIAFSNVSEGSCYVEANINNKMVKSSLKFQTFPIDQILKNSLPFALIVTLIAVVVGLLTIKKKDDLVKLINLTNKLNAYIEKRMKEINESQDDKKKRKQIKKIYSYIKKIEVKSLSIANMASLEHNSDISNVIQLMNLIKNQSIASLKVALNDQSVEMNLKIIEKIVQNIIKQKAELVEIKETFEKFKDNYYKEDETIKYVKKKFDFKNKQQYDKYLVQIETNGSNSETDDTADDGKN